MRWIWILALGVSGLVGGLSGCAESSKPLQEPCRDGVCAQKIGSMTPEEYYGQFAFKSVGDCQAPDQIWFKSMGTVGDVRIGSTEDGRPLLASLQINLLETGDYHALYEETARSGVDDREIVYRTQFWGTWKIRGLQLELSNLGDGSATSYVAGETTKHGVSLHVTTNVRHPGIVDQNLLLAARDSKFGPYGETVEAFCKSKKK